MDKLTSSRGILYVVGLALLALIGAPVAQAGTSIGPITGLRYMNTQGGMVVFAAGTHTAKPSCHTNAGDDWGFALTTDENKALYGMLLVAYAKGATVTVKGFTISCLGGNESPTMVQIND